MQGDSRKSRREWLWEVEDTESWTEILGYTVPGKYWELQYKQCEEILVSTLGTELGPQKDQDIGERTTS